MHALTIAALTALHALAHRFDLTDQETALLDREAPSLSPAVWELTARLLASADAAGDGAHLDIGFENPVLAWLGLADEADCRECFGLSVHEAIERDRGNLSTVVHAIHDPVASSTPEPSDVRIELAGVWRDRTLRMVEADEDCAVPAYLRALATCPLPDDTLVSLWEAFIDACEEQGRSRLAQLARRTLKELNAAEHAADDPVPFALVLLLSVLWCITHERFLLQSEGGLDPAIERSLEEWERIRQAAARGSLDEIPIPIETARAWAHDRELDAEALRACLSRNPALVPDLLTVLEAAWSGGADLQSVPRLVLRRILQVASGRRVRIDTDYEPLPGEPHSIPLEVHQGARRPDAVERHALLQSIDRILAKCAPLDPPAQMCLALDDASEAEARGDHAATLRHIEEARRASAHADYPNLREYADVVHARYLWHTGEVGEAGAVLAGLSTDFADRTRQLIAEHADARAVLSRAVAIHHRDDDLDSWCAVARAELAAGHSIAAERTARAACRAHPRQPLAWTTLASLLHEHGRHRSAVEPAREAVRLSEGSPSPLALLARVLSRIGSDGYTESVAFAERAIVAMVRAGFGSADDLASLADIVGRAALRGDASTSSALAADDLVWLRRLEHVPALEWVGAAAARRCAGPDAWAPDALIWLSRLAAEAASESAALARWVVDRVDSLQTLRARSAQVLGGQDPSSGPDATLADQLTAALCDPSGLSPEREVVEVVLGAARSLGYSFDHAAAALGLSGDDLHSLGEKYHRRSPAVFVLGNPGPDWTEHLSALAAAFGIGLVVRLRASAEVQRALGSLDPAAEGSAAVVGVGLAVLESEQVAWIRWAAEQPELRTLQVEDSPLAASTRVRLVRLMGLATLHEPASHLWNTPSYEVLS